MAYLNWKESELKIGVSSHPDHSKFKTQLNLTLDQELRASLLNALEDVYLNNEGELRLDLAQGWVVFWKMREQGSRVLLSHPQEKEWVGTLALDLEVAEKLLSALKGLQSGEAVVISQLGLLESMSNLDVSLKI